MKRYTRQITWKRNNLTQENIIKRIENYCKATRCVYANLVITDTEITFITYSNITYENLVNKLVREKYTDSEEFAILRKALTEKTNEFYIYNAYVEECKTQAKAFIEERNKALNK